MYQLQYKYIMYQLQYKYIIMHVWKMASNKWNGLSTFVRIYIHIMSYTVSQGLTKTES